MIQLKFAMVRIHGNIIHLCVIFDCSVWQLRSAPSAGEVYTKPHLHERTDDQQVLNKQWKKIMIYCLSCLQNVKIFINIQQKFSQPFTYQDEFNYYFV